MMCTNCGKENNSKFCTFCGVKTVENNLETLLVTYFKKGFTYKEILDLLLNRHDLNISLRTLKTKLKKLNLQRNKKSFSQLNDAFEIVSKEIASTSSSIGYRTMWHSLSHKYGVRVPRDFIMCSMRTLDPQGTIERKSRCLKRRSYKSGGPNFLWHCDGYDKLKPYGFPIHGGIDGFSRKIIWLRVVSSNNNPATMASLFVKAVEDLGVFPYCVRTDCGTENGLIAAAQSFLHRKNDHKAHMFGSSHHNQRIESWWSQFRRLKSGYLMGFFKDMVEEGLYNTGNPSHKACAFFCFAVLIQRELDECREQWNCHYIRSSKSSEVHGRPDYIYSVVPNNFKNFGTTIDQADMNIINEHIDEYSVPVDLEKQDTFIDYFEYCHSTMQLPANSNFDVAKENFLKLLSVLDY